MKRQMILAVFVLILISFIYVEYAFAGAWTLPKYKIWGEYYMKWDYAKEEFNAESKRKQLSEGNDARSWEFIMEPKLEFGVTDYITALGSIEYKQSHYKQYGRSPDIGPYSHKNNGVSNVKLGGRVRLIEKPVVLSIQPKFFIYPGYGNYHGDDPAYNNQPSIGYGDDAFELRALIGKTFDIPVTKKFKLPCYLGAETGYRWRSRSVCGDVPYFIEGGFWPVEWFLVKSELDGYMCNPGTGSIKESYGIWRIGGIWQVFGGDYILRKGNKLFNIEFQYGMTLWGKNTTAYQEFVLKTDVQF